MVPAPCFAGCAAGKPVVLVQDSQPAATIAIRDDAGNRVKGRHRRRKATSSR